MHFACYLNTNHRNVNSLDIFPWNAHYQSSYPSSAIQVVPCGRKEGWTDKQTVMTKLIFAVRNFAKAPKNITAGNFNICQYSQNLGIELLRIFEDELVWVKHSKH